MARFFVGRMRTSPRRDRCSVECRMLQDAHLTYPPLNTLKPLADGIWIVDGPVIWFGVRGFKMPFPTRATVIPLRTETCSSTRPRRSLLN
jgi:hypothetical protein